MKNILYLFIIASLVCSAVDAKKTRRNKRPKSEDDSTPQPNVVTYSTFGFNDVGTYDGFVPSSPDYVNYLSNYNQDSSTRLYAPAFPTALDNYPSPSQNSPTFSLDDDAAPQASMIQYPQSSFSFSNTPSLDNEGQSQHVAQEIYGRNAGESEPIYGTKIGSRTRNKGPHQLNNTEYNNLFSSASSHSESKFPSFHEIQSAFDNKPSYESKPTFESKPAFDSKPSFSEDAKKYQFNFNYATTHPSTESEDFMKPAQGNTQGSINFPKVIDFTKYKQYYPTELETKVTTTTTTRAPYTFKPTLNIQNENSYFNNFEEFSTKYPSISSSFKDPFKVKDIEDETDEEISKPFLYPETDFTQNFLKNTQKDNKFNFDYKDKFKYNSWPSTNFTNDFKSWKNPIKGYQYSTNVSNMNFEFDFSGAKKPSNDNYDEVVPASSNIELSNYQFPVHDYSSFKKIPGYKGFDNDDIGNVFDSAKPLGYNLGKYDPEAYVKSLYSTVPETTNHFGSPYKNPYSSYKFPKRPQFGEDNDDVVHIGSKRPYGNKYGFGKFTESRPTEWSSYTSHRPYKPKKHASDWTKDVPTRYKSEEDLLGLRNHDTSQTSYLPTFRPGNSIGISSDYDYKNLVEKWRQSYLKAKYKDAGLHDFDSYASEPKPLHVPVPKPYAIEVPHPVIVPVPQPYPVRVPIPKPVAVPVVRELTVSVEKPVPYPVIKKVPYPIEKPVPVPVEKEVPVPVVKPYPVPIPHIRPVFHHTRPREEVDAGLDEEDDYLPRPEKKIPYAKRVKSTRTRSRRPTRTYERNRRRWPTRRPESPRTRRPDLPAPYRHYEDIDDFEHSHREYIRHCKRTGNC